MNQTTDTNLVECIYSSAAIKEFSPAELEELLAVSRKNNSKLGITGILLYEKGFFFQILDDGRAKKLLAAFKEGKWRSKIK